MFIKIATGRDAATGEGLQYGFKGTAAFGLKSGLEIPKRSAAEFHTFDFASHKQSYGHALHSTGRKTRGDFFPEERTERVSEEPVDDSPGFLSLDQVFIEFPSVANSLQNCRFCDF